MYTVASPDPNPRGGGQLPNPNECNSTLNSGTNNIYPNPYIDINDRGHRLRITHTPRRQENMFLGLLGGPGACSPGKF